MGCRIFLMVFLMLLKISKSQEHQGSNLQERFWKNWQAESAFNQQRSYRTGTMNLIPFFSLCTTCWRHISLYHLTIVCGSSCVVTIYCLQALGQYGILCLEDLVTEIAYVGPHFKEVTSFLCPFTLTKPEKALQGKKKRFSDGGDSGNREDHINELVSKMN